MSNKKLSKQKSDTTLGKGAVSGLVCRITKAQIESIWQAKEDMKAMLGCGEDNSHWKRYIKHMEKFLISNGLTEN